ncbi:MAG TPA: glycosyltransferase [Actinocrinis sp.]|nr:glycosyltransferase [Actinocrinis sp.]
MSRVLIVVPPLAGHVNPTVALGRALTESGHEVAWSGSEFHIRPLLGDAAAVFTTGSKLLRDQGGQGLAAVKSLWEGFVVPYARFSAKAVDRAVREYEPDVVVVDQHTPAGAIAAHRNAVRWATIASSSMESGRPLRAFPKVEAWITDHLKTLWQSGGLPEAEFADPRFSPDLVLALTSSALVDPEHFGAGAIDGSSHAAQTVFTGPLLGGRPGGADFPWEALDPARVHLLVSMGTLAADVSAHVHERAAHALRLSGERIQGIVSGPPELADAYPDGTVVRPTVPVLDLFGRGAIDAVLCHGGQNTVCEALAHGLPLVAAPIRHDQPVVAAQVAAAGAGLRVSFRRADGAELHRAVETVLADPSYRSAAEKIRAQFAADGGAATAVAAIERLLIAP